MGFFAVPSAPAGASINADFATYDLALADARANGAAGDLYRLTTEGGVWRVFGSGATAFLVPADWYDRLTVVSNASGSCLFVLGDALADLTARGWVSETSASGAVAKSAGGALELDASASSGSYGRVAFTPTGTPNNFFWIAKIRAISTSGGTPLVGYAGILCRNADDFLKIGFTEATAFASGFCGSSNSGTTSDTASTEATFSAGWIMGFLDAGAGDSLLVQQVGASLRAVLMPSGNADAVATGRIVRVEAMKHTSAVVVGFDVDEFLCCSF